VRVCCLCFVCVCVCACVCNIYVRDMHLEVVNNDGVAAGVGLECVLGAASVDQTVL
jgi:hypothetical protein